MDTSESVKNFKNFTSKVVIALATFNRKKMTELCISNLIQTKQDATLYIYDDHSTEYDLEWLKGIAPGAKVIRKPTKLGIERIRIEAQIDALADGYEYIYHTDNDAIHDPQWLEQIHSIVNDYPHGWVSLYHSKIHKIIQTDARGRHIKVTCPGISFFYPVKNLENHMDEVKRLEQRFWDFTFGKHLKYCVCSGNSFVEHFGVGGLHNSDFERDRASDPTPFLIEKRKEILSYFGVTPQP